MLIYSSPRLIAVNRVLLRLLMPRHSPYALLRLNFLLLFVLFELSEFHFEHGYFLFVKRHFWLPSSNFHLAISCFGEIVVNYPKYWKDLKLTDRYLMSSISVRFNSFLFSYSIFNERKFPSGFGVATLRRGLKSQRFAVLPRLLGAHTVGWSVWMDSNHRPRAYQARALTT